MGGELRSSMADPPIGFATLMELEQLDATTFRSRTAAFQPGGPFRPPGSARAYGGHVYAQAVLAAAGTVPKGMVVHVVTGFFTALGDSLRPYVYAVQKVRTGKSYAVRSVAVTQGDGADPFFICTASFKRAEPTGPNPFATKAPDFSEALKGIPNEEQPDYLSTDEVFFEELPPEKQRDPLAKFPGLVTKKVDMKAYNARRPLSQRRQLSFYRTRDVLPPFAEAPNLHAAALLYATDRASLLSSGQMMGFYDHKAMASLAHTVVLHATDDTLSWTGDDGRKRWLMQEAWTTGTADSRLDHQSRLWDDQGRHLATTLQDGMVRGIVYNEGAKPKSNL